jgi:hypothetical protein
MAIDLTALGVGLALHQELRPGCPDIAITDLNGLVTANAGFAQVTNAISQVTNAVADAEVACRRDGRT